ncbi:hypothetical protein CDD80_5423 [Ophiocordyceps camponoti-rufipedis]|uniref:SH3 domain-containing protein n=1 Tax=Ophiocordyceps camponoti-rufipedis TaxID=2004952 RepID=A0A2C5YTZ7_9HYPO|nr:hypothetical protein CDD80_5423 [Ophiocordyceps camponoti-rufipedis]
MVSAERQTIMETNRSLRNIKTELESLLEKGVIDESVFDSIHAALPQESPLSGPLRTTANRSEAPTQAMNNMTLSPEPRSESQAPAPAPPSYNDTPPPSLPTRNAKPVVGHARALYSYAASDARDVAFEKDDRIAIHERLNPDWWLGQNMRTGQEGIFPRSYVLEEPDSKGTPQPGPAAAPYVQPQQPQYGYPPPQQNPYNANVPPMAVADDGHSGGNKESKGSQLGKKFGKKLGNAAIFGAGATIGGNIVNSIF